MDPETKSNAKPDATVPNLQILLTLLISINLEQSRHFRVDYRLFFWELSHALKVYSPVCGRCGAECSRADSCDGESVTAAAEFQQWTSAAAGTDPPLTATRSSTVDTVSNRAGWGRAEFV